MPALVRNTRMRAQRPVQGMQTQVPFAQAVNIRQSAPNRIVTMSGKEQFATFTVSAASTPGQVQLFDINPADLEDTRLKFVSQSFQEYRVKRLAVTLVTNLPTTAGGSIVIGSTSNPDQLIETSNQVFALNGAQIASMYVPVVVNCNYSKTWLKVDPDNVEAIMSTCCRVAVALQSSASITGTAVCPLLLDWVIEFRGSAIQSFGGGGRQTVFTFPRCNVTSVDATAGYNVFLAPITGETLPLPPIAAERGYEITGSFVVTDIEENERVVKVIRLGPRLGGQSYYFFDSEDDYLNFHPIRVKFIASTTYPRFILELLN